MFSSFVHAVSGSWAYPAVFAVALLDAFFPVVPSETVVITAGVLAADGRLDIVVVMALASLGAFLGDQVSYGLGRYVGFRIVERFLSSPRARERLHWAEVQLRRRGPYLIVVGRFVPGGRTAVTFCCGLLEWRWRRFVLFDGLAALVWGVYASLLGYVGGTAFEKQPLKGLLVAFAFAVAVGVAVEVVRHLRGRRRAGRRAQVSAAEDEPL